MNDFKKDYQLRTNIVKDEKSNLVVDCHKNLAQWRKLFYQLLNIYGVNDVKQTKIHTAKPLMPAPSAFEFVLAIENLKSNISPGTDQIPAE